ncbi:hypothetical protein AB9V60_12695 [Pseudomonas syringae pv. atrofaciens]|uniref:hypothetical protein n=1 Tax=Pseudomonas syringae TaxID=317 RepID=UPI00351F60B1
MPNSLAMAAAPSPVHTVASIPQKLFDASDQRFTHDLFAQAWVVQSILNLVKICLGGQAMLGHELLDKLQYPSTLLTRSRSSGPMYAPSPSVRFQV